MATLHITNGSHAGDKLKTFVDGPVAISADALHEGPATRVEGDAWYDLRAGHISEGYPAGEFRCEDVRAQFAATDGLIREHAARIADLSRGTDARSGKAAGEKNEIVLWFEHDLFDQLQLIRTLDFLVRLKADTTEPHSLKADTTETHDGFSQTRPSVVSGCSRTVFLICIDRFPGVDRFIGLGQLEPAELASLYPSRQPVTARQFALASAAWDAFRSPDPRELLRIARDAGDLPFLGDALLRFLAEYPSVDRGLSRTETLALTALGDEPRTAGDLFVASQRQEPRPFMGDLTFYEILQSLAGGRVPLLAIDGAAESTDLRSRAVSLTPAGRDVRAGRLDRVALNGIDLWRGGVHLVGSDRSPWRWDTRAETLVS